jgi:hypothetical protein
MRSTNRPQDVLTVRAMEGRIVLMDENGTVAWGDHDEPRMIHRLFEFAVAREAINALDETTEVLERHDGGQPHYRSTEARLIARNRLILARSLPSPQEVETLVKRNTQLTLWRRAA